MAASSLSRSNSIQLSDSIANVQTCDKIMGSMNPHYKKLGARIDINRAINADSSLRVTQSPTANHDTHRQTSRVTSSHFNVHIKHTRALTETHSTYLKLVKLLV